MEEKTDIDIFEKMFGKANPPEGKKYDFAHVSVSNPRLGVICFQWSARGFGFGEVTMLLREGGGTFIDTECSSDRFVNELLGFVVSNAIKDRDENGHPIQTPNDCYGSAGQYKPEKIPTSEELCVAAEVVERLVKHHGLPNAELIGKLREMADDAYAKWFDKTYMAPKESK